MSRYIRLLNSIKANIATLQLTPSQQACRARIEERLAYPGIVNLYGHPGTGKTVLGWALAHDGPATFVIYSTQRDLDTVRQRDFVFVDNAEADHRAFRSLLGELENAGVQRAVIATHYPVDDYVFRTELNLTDEDIAVALQNLKELGFRANESRFSTLWHLAQQATKET